MELSILVARILALTYISTGIAVLSGKIDFHKMMEDFEKSAGLTYVSGFFTLVVGMILVTYHNIWPRDWRIIVTIVGWLTLFKGIRFIAFPQSVKLFKGLFTNTKAWGVMLMGLGLLFGYFGFIVG
jgi:hypothetical protein